MKAEKEIAAAMAESPEGFLDLTYRGAKEGPITYRELREKSPKEFAALTYTDNPMREHILKLLIDEGERPDDTLVIPYGKHKGKTIAETMIEDARYLYWLAGTKPPSLFSSQLSLVLDAMPAQDEILPFGKYEGQRFSQAMLDYDYAAYWLDKEDLTDVMARFVVYMDKNC
jgi:uncharacterized protein (DUF3820 family)